MEPIAELGRNYQQMALVEKWDKVVHYLYPIAQSVPRKHGERDRLARFIPSWLGHARWADANHLLTWLETRHGLALASH